MTDQKDYWKYPRNITSYFRIHEYLRKSGRPIMSPQEISDLSISQFEQLRAEAGLWLIQNRKATSNGCVICGCEGSTHSPLNPNAWLCFSHATHSSEVLELAEGVAYLREAGKEMIDEVVQISTLLEDAIRDGICQFCNVDLVQGAEHTESCLISKLAAVRMRVATSPFAIS